MKKRVLPIKYGFTLIEMLVVIIIIGILATLATTQWGSYRESALNREAQANLRLIRAAERIYRMEASTYTDCANTPEVNSNLKLDIPTATTANWKYKVDTVTSTTFIGRAQRNGSDYRVWCINQNPDQEPFSGCFW